MRAALMGLLLVVAGCSTPSRPASPAPPSAGEDSVRLTNGEIVRGRIVEENARQVVVEREQHVSSYPRGAVYSIDYSKERSADRAPNLRQAEPPSGSARPPSTWYPRLSDREPVQQTEVLFFDSHALGDCLGGALAKAHQDFPDLRIFAEPGGKIVLQDPRLWGYHAHLPEGGFRIPAGKPGLTIELPREESRLPGSVAFVSPAQEIKSGDDEGRTSYAVPDAVYAGVKPLEGADAMLSAQPFAGGKPLTTANGTLWAFTLPRNARQFFVYLLDPLRRHGEILRASYVAYGDTILAADLLIDSIGADGVAVGRVLVVPYPDNVSADGPAPQPVIVYAGPTHDPTTIARVPMPPREAVQLPAKAASTKADVLVSHYEVTANIPQSIVLAHGAGRPTKDVTLVARELTPRDPDQIVKIDLSSLPEERFPAVVWLYQRRTFVWRTTGGHLPPAAPRPVPAGADTKLARVKKSAGIAHVLPLLFLGPKPGVAGVRISDPAAGVAGGMSSALLRDSLGSGANSITQNLSPGPATGPAGDGAGGVSNVTYVYITSPPHTAAGDLGGAGGLVSGSGTGLSGMYLQNHGNSSAFPLRGGGQGALGPIGTYDGRTGTFYDPSGQPVKYDPATGVTSGDEGLNYVDPRSNVGIPIRRTRR